MILFENMFKKEQYRSIMLLAIFGFVLFSIPFSNISNIFRVILLIGSLGIFFYHRDSIYKDPMIIFLGLAIVSSVISWGNSFINIPSMAKSAPEIDKLARLFIFIPIAYWIRGDRKLIFFLFLSFAFSFTIGMIVKSNFVMEYINGINGNRVDFSIKNAQYTSMFSGLFVLLIAFLITHLKIKNFSSKKICILSYSLLLVSLLFFLSIMVISQSRMVFFSFVFVLLAYPILNKMAFKRSGIKKMLFFYAGTIIIMTLLFFLVAPTLESRFSGRDIQTINDIMNLNFENIPMSSIGIRLNSWFEASHWIAAHPFFGVGVHGPSAVIETSALFTARVAENYKILEDLHHLHSFHFDTLVMYGVFGFLVLNGTYFIVLRSLLKLSSNYKYLNIWFLLASCVVVYWFTINGFESFNYRTYGVLTHNIFMAAFYTFALTHRLFPTLLDEKNNENSGSCQ